MSQSALLVDDDDQLRALFHDILLKGGFTVTCASNVPEALKAISAGTFDLLLSDLHMPGAGDGLTIVSAMRHSNPKTVTIILSAFPEMEAAAHAIMLQADRILVKPMSAKNLLTEIKERLAIGAPPITVIETVATILERSTSNTIKSWYELIEADEAVMSISMSFHERTDYLPGLFQELVERLRSSRAIGMKDVVSTGAVAHGLDRRRRGYTAAMMVEESRMLQVSIFKTLYENMATINYSVLLPGIMTIADEIDSQLSQAMKSYVAEAKVDALSN